MASRITSGVIRVLALSMLSLATASAALAQQPAPAPGPSESIKVHGHWAITIRNADGTIARHEEFQNALGGGGMSMLANMLGRTQTIGYWTIDVFDRTSSPCQGGTSLSFPNDCHIVEAAGTDTRYIGTNVFRNLVVTNTGINGVNLVLQGSATALANGLISEVFTKAGSCAATSVPGGCGQLSSPSPFSQRNLPSAIPVTAGQIIQVTVTFTFS